MVVPCWCKEPSVLDRMSRLTRQVWFVWPTKTCTKEEVCMALVMELLWLGLCIYRTVVAVMIHIISTTKAVILVVELFEWVRIFMALHSKSLGSTTSPVDIVLCSVSAFMSLYKPCHSKLQPPHIWNHWSCSFWHVLLWRGWNKWWLSWWRFCCMDVLHKWRIEYHCCHPSVGCVLHCSSFCAWFFEVPSWCF